ncbi:MAG TPA: DedA family protein [Solirubrobacteraceae bacterium]|nr:DedA family protein [Solirubrobacteraceae bacterium]
MLAIALVLASVTDKLADWATNVVGDLGLPGIFLLMVPESACIPIPSEATMLFAGFNVSEGRYSLVAAVLVASVANLVGSWIAYAVGYYGRIEAFERHRVFHVGPAQIARAERWFEKYGSAAVFFSRMLPVVRTFISLPAGVARMPIVRFSVLTFLGAVPWNLMLVLIGKSARDDWDTWKDRLHYVDYAVAALIVAGAVYLVVRWARRRSGRDDPPDDIAPSLGDGPAPADAAS